MASSSKSVLNVAELTAAFPKRVDAEAYPDRQRDGQENHPDHAQAKPRALERKLLLTQRDTPFPIRF